MSSTSVEFCDTNVLVYAYAPKSRAKHEKAQQLLDRLWFSGSGALSLQVLQEFYVTLTRKVGPGLSPVVARTVIADLCRWRVMEPTRADILAAIAASTRWHLSFRDALIVTSANVVGASVLWSEDLQHGQVFNETTVRNPFR